MGSGVVTEQLTKMVAGAINPGRPVANLYVRLFIHPIFIKCLMRSPSVFHVE